MALKQPYIILSQRSSVSKVYGTPMTEIRLVGCKDRLEYVTYIDQGNQNHSQWQHITRNPQHGFILRNLRTTKRTTKSGLPLINADSEPIIEWEDTDMDKQRRQLAELWAEEDRKNDSDKFGDLFE